jgi:hypothetical protein
VEVISETDQLFFGSISEKRSVCFTLAGRSGSLASRTAHKASIEDDKTKLRWLDRHLGHGGSR